MKAGVLLLLSFQLVLSALAQGTVVFNNRNTAIGLDAPINYYGLGPGTAFSAGLYFNGTLVLGSLTTFRAEPDGPQPALAKYIIPVTVTIPGTQIEQRNVPVQMRVWLAAAGSYENSSPLTRASSGDLIIAQLGGGANPDVNNSLPVSFSGLIFPFPEPSTLALGTTAAALFFTPRRRHVS